MFFSPILLTLALGAAAEPTYDVPSLTPKPNRCVSLREGRNCYTEVTLSWRASIKQDYCLFVENRKQPLKCWQKTNSGTFRHDFASAESLSFQLKASPYQKSVVETEVSVGWVYDSSSNKKRRWRIF